MSSTLSKQKRGQEADERAMPDSTTTTISAEYASGQDILLKQKDGRYYLGTVVQVDHVREQCLVKFGDNTNLWSCFKDLMKLSMGEQEDLLCVVCKKSAPKSKKEIVVCENCGRGYHQRCHQPNIDSDCKDEWNCKRCLDLSKTKRKTNYLFKPLPYNLESLTWDDYHQVNEEGKYCYCGESGDWMKQMLQCGRCRQWFHDKCIDCLKYPVYCGDRFYIFVCTNCNDGKEFLRRLEIEWVDLVHLLLFNLTTLNSKKYYDLDSVIVPYMDDNWRALQLSPKILNAKTNKKETVLSVLTTNRNRFKCGKEIKKRTTIWGLRVRLPPPAPTIQLSAKGMITEENLRQKWTGSKRLQYLPYNEFSGVIRISSDIMSGAAYQTDQNLNSETESSPVGSPAEEDYMDDKSFAGAVKKSGQQLPKLSLKAKKRLLSYSGRKRELFMRRQKRKATRELPRRATRLSLDSRNTSASQKRSPLTPPTSVSAPPTPPTSGSNSNVPSELSIDYNEHASFEFTLKKEKRLQSTADDLLHTPCDTSGDETSSKSTLDLIIPPPKDFEGKNNPFLAFPRFDDHPLSASDGPSKGNRKRSKDITLPLPLTAVIPPLARPAKRQLSEKDICIGPNGEVKRRRLRRSKGLANNAATNAAAASAAGAGSYATASKTATVLPVKADPDWTHAVESNLIANCVDYALNGRRLRQRPSLSNASDKEKKAGSGQTTPKPSPVKTEPDINMDDLKSSVHSYFGAATRISDGERYTVRAKRYGPSGKMEYLMEWEGLTATSAAVASVAQLAQHQPALQN